MKTMTLKEQVTTILDRAIFSQGHDDIMRLPASKIASDLQILEPGLGFYTYEEIKAEVLDYMEQN